MALPGVHLLEVEPDLGAFLSSEDRELAASVSVPLRVLEAGDLQVDRLLREAGAFGALVLEGMVLHRMTVGGRRALRLLGPGDLVNLIGSLRTEALGATHELTAEARLAILDDHLLVAIRRFPRLVTGFHVRMGEQQERLATQLVICQMPRVEDRVLALMWLLAETWGRVTSSGTSLPLVLTHDVIGEMVGARRSTVTLAVTHLVECGSLMRQDQGWLLLNHLPEMPDEAPGGAPELVPELHSGWKAPPSDERRVPTHLVAVETVAALRRSHQLSAERVRAGLAQAALSRDRSRDLRLRINQQRSGANAGRRAPS